MTLLASIPSPSFNSIDIGPLSLNIYGLAIALGVVAAVWLIGRRFEARGIGTADDASSIAVGAVLAGVIGARLYHVATDWDRFANSYGDIPKIWEGGLGIPGGLMLGIPVGLYLAHVKGVPVAAAATCTAPGLALAQAIGRWGNYFNQELYGRETDLPWALEIDADHLVTDPATGVDFAVGTTFHPTFLYESLWSLALVFVLLYVDRRWRPGGGSLMALYIAGYGLGRFWIEGLRVDPADELGPFRWNQWVALAAVIGGGIAFSMLRHRPDPAPVDRFDELEDLGDADLVELDAEVETDAADGADLDAEGGADVDPDIGVDDDESDLESADESTGFVRRSTD